MVQAQEFISSVTAEYITAIPVALVFGFLYTCRSHFKDWSTAFKVNSGHFNLVKKFKEHLMTVYIPGLDIPVT